MCLGGGGAAKIVSQVGEGGYALNLNDKEGGWVGGGFAARQKGEAEGTS